mmetsp:Transcript_59946/g.82343  ORF Transcript_59946/g.82343 Transcript_59946/m.82343 type:complete len:200 (+) Transcript_59946:441-1040(+)
MLNQVIDTHLSVTFVVSSSYINESILHLIFTSNKDIVPLSQLGISNLFVNLTRGIIPGDLETFAVQVSVNALAVAIGFLRDRDDNNLSRRDEERPFTGKMFNQNSHKSLDGTKNSSVNNNRSLETRLKSSFLPDKFFLVEFISAENLFSKLHIFLSFFIVFVLSGFFLLFCTTFSLVLQIESYGKLEITLDGTALVRSL